MPLAPASYPDGAAGKLRVQADTLARAGKCTQAEPLYKEACELDPFDTAAYDGIAHCMFRRGAYVPGAALISLALRDNPDYDTGWLHLARLDRAAGRRERAVGSYRKFLFKQPGHLEAQLELARTLKSLGLKDDAIAAYQHYLRGERRSTANAYRLAAYLELKALGGRPLEVPRAESSAQSAAAKPTAKPTGKAAKSGKLRSAASVPEVAAASPDAAVEASAAVGAAAAGTAVEASVEKPKTRTQLRAEARRKAAEERKAKEEARREELAEKKRQREEVRRQALEERKAKAEARRAAAEPGRRERRAGTGKRARTRPATEDEALAGAVGRDLGESSPVAENAAAEHDVLKPAPDAARGLVAIADAQFAKQRYDVALGLYQQAGRLNPSASEPLYKAGVSAVALGQMHLAADLFGRVLQLDPGNATASVSLKMAKAAAQGGRPEPKYLDSAAAEAQASLDAHRYALALQQSEKLLRLEVSARAYLIRAQARLGLRQPQAALQDGGRSLALDPGLLQAFRCMAEAHRQLGARDKALYYLRLYLARGGSSLDGDKRADAERAVKELSQPE